MSKQYLEKNLLVNNITLFENDLTDRVCQTGIRKEKDK